MHWEQAEHNEKIASELIGQNPIEYKDWAEITSFYSAIHYVEAYMAEQLNLHSAKNKDKYESPHHFRSDIVRKHLSSIVFQYEELSKVSKILRYLTEANGTNVARTKGDYLTEEDIKIFFNDDLQTIKMEIAQILNKDGIEKNQL